MSVATDILTAIANPGACLTSREIAEMTGHSPVQIGTAAGRLISSGRVERVERGCYRLTVNGADLVGKPLPLGPRQGKHRSLRDTFRQRAWNAMRIMGTFTAPDVLVRAARPSDRRAQINLGGFLRGLVRAGIIAETGRRTSATAKVYRLKQDVGDRAPSVGKSGKAVAS